MPITINTIDVAINGRYLEAKAKVSVYPGMLLERYEDGVRPHSIAEGTAPPLIAMENRFRGTDIITAYEVDDIVYMRYCLPGDVFWGRYGVHTPDINRFLVSAGVLNPGYLVVAGLTPIDGAVVGRELEDISLEVAPFTTFVKVETM